MEVYKCTREVHGVDRCVSQVTHTLVLLSGEEASGSEEQSDEEVDGEGEEDPGDGAAEAAEHAANKQQQRQRMQHMR